MKMHSIGPNLVTISTSGHVLGRVRTGAPWQMLVSGSTAGIFEACWRRLQPGLLPGREPPASSAPAHTDSLSRRIGPAALLWIVERLHPAVLLERFECKSQRRVSQYDVDLVRSLYEDNGGAQVPSFRRQM